MHRLVIIALVILTAAATTSVAAAQDERVDYSVDTPLYTLRGPDSPLVAIIQTDIEVEYIGDYLGLDERRAESALRLLGHVDFAESMLLIVNGGPVEGAMLRVESVYESGGALHVDVVMADPPGQYRDDGFSSPASNEFTPSLVTVLPRCEGVIFVHVFEAEWATSGDLRGIQLVVTAREDEGAVDDEGASDAD
jgi:hypothetical protein